MKQGLLFFAAAILLFSFPVLAEPVAVPLSNTALYLGFLLIGGLMFFRTYRMS